MGGLTELHRHLDGSLRVSTVHALARALETRVPDALLFHPGMGLDAALERFAFTLSLLQEPAALTRVASEMCEDAEAEGITHLEIRFAPQLHGGSVESAVEAVLTGISGRAGLILCGLYGEAPMVLDALVSVGSRYPGVVGIDLAGGPAPHHSWSLAEYRQPFQRAKSLGLGRTVHAAEGRSPEEIRIAIEELGAQRIGHGTTLLLDESVVELVVERGVTLEACVTSNVHTGVISETLEHPVGLWLERGIQVAICTDNTLFSDVSLPQELARVERIAGVGESGVATLVKMSRAAIFSG
jgi:adenosine deaminase